MSLMILIIAIALTPSTSSINTNSVESSSALSHRGGDGLSPILITRLASIVFLFSGALAYNALYIQSIGSGLSLYSGLFQVSVLSQSFDFFIFILAALILIPWPNKRIGFNSYVLSGPLVKEYSLILLFSALGSSLLLSSGNLLSMYLSIELQSFGVYILATIYRNSESATNAGLKYFLLGGLSSCLILLGCVLIYSYTGLIYFEDIYSITAASNAVSNSGSLYLISGDINTIIQLGLVFIFVGFLFKVAGAPFHNWAPDVYNDVPTMVTTWLTIMPKIAILIVAFELISTSPIAGSLNSLIGSLGSIDTLGQANGVFLITNLLLISSFLSLIIGTIAGLAQVKIKRLLAYSTISHIGFLLLALSINTEDSLESFIFYLIQYSITNLNTFFILLAFGYIINQGLRSNKKDINLISDLKGQFATNPLLSLSLALCLFSMAGIPPLMGFFAKAQVLYSSIQNGYYFISIIAILVSVVSAYYYLQIIKVMHFDSADSNDTSLITNPSLSSLAVESDKGESLTLESSPVSVLNNTHTYLISVLTLSLTLFMLKPSILLNSIHLMALNIFYT
jgi:NADH-ubiquinone oxidoreductase chain 2